MKIPVRWLKEFVSFELTPEELAKLFIDKGLEVENIIRVGEHLEKIVVGEIVDVVDQHYNISIGSETVAVTGRARRLAKGERVAVARRGTETVSGKKTPVDTILTDSEFGLGDSAEPVILPHNWKAGTPVLDLLDDYVLELRPPSNRGDLWGMVGVARELATYLGKPLKLPDRTLVESESSIDDLVRLDVQDREGCPRYVARLITDLAVGPSPFSLAWRLWACGSRSVNNVVDITNLILLERGQPLHAFDFERLEGGVVVVRRAKAGEQLLTLDGELRKLTPDILVIADERRPIALAGIMGGKDTEVSGSTTTVLLESAYFAPVVTRRASQKLKLATEASRRFEMGVDIGSLDSVSRSAAAMMGVFGKPRGGSLEVAQPQKQRTVELSVAKTNRLLGVTVDGATIRNYLTALGFEVSPSNTGFLVDVPSYRSDITRDAELVEEIARLYGYERIPGSFSLNGNDLGGHHPQSRRLNDIREFLVNSGFTEIRTISFIPERIFDLAGQHRPLKLQNPLSERYAAMRPNLVLGALETAALNYRRGNPDVRVFEIGKVFGAGKPPKETQSLGGLVLGEAFPRFWQERPRPVSLFDMKGVVEMLCVHLGLEDLLFRSWDGDGWFGAGARVSGGSETLGHIGEVAPALRAEYDLGSAAFVFELDLDRILDFAPKYKVYSPLPKFPPVHRDLSLVAAAEVEAAELEKVIRKAAGALLERISIFDYFTGGTLPPGTKAIGVRLVIRSEERTLSGEDVERLMSRVVKRLEEQWGVHLRTKGG